MLFGFVFSCNLFYCVFQNLGLQFTGLCKPFVWHCIDNNAHVICKTKNKQPMNSSRLLQDIWYGFKPNPSHKICLLSNGLEAILLLLYAAFSPERLSSRSSACFSLCMIPMQTKWKRGIRITKAVCKRFFSFFFFQNMLRMYFACKIRC